MIDMSWLGPAIDARPLFAGQQAAFVALLEDLRPDDWDRATACPGWSVKDIAAHVLGDHVGRLSMLRDGYQVLGPREGEAFTAFIDRINDEWVTAARRISPPLLIDQLATVGEQVVAYWQTIDPGALGLPVSWAGPEPHPAWLDAARDFTEYWTHHQQICDATGQPGLDDPGYAGPVIDTFMRALPHTLREVSAPEGTSLQVIVTGPGAGAWTCTRGAERWGLERRPEDAPDASLELDTDTAWRLCTRGIDPGTAAGRARATGDPRLTEAALQIVSIIWTPSSGT
ncbi:maleylpyruvate isomerase family mycothiol-dependent enzyme [Actinomadura vinacea]|uniref:Maleylpyruvate isomerase family mycothiol-dependent enzyme n=1 Tax=Actinomadura vinacea TaxID=115336 RepID=A0ABN3IC10_9ACTN